MIAVATNAGLKVYGFTKFGVTPAGGARAGTLLELEGFMLSPVFGAPVAVSQPRHTERGAPAATYSNSR